MALHVYQILPIDFGWEQCPTVEEYYAALAKEELHGHTRPEALKQFKDDFRQAKELASDKGWEGDIRGDAHVFMVPAEGEFIYGFAWKQENNGTTYVVSPVEFPNLEKIEC